MILLKDISEKKELEYKLKSIVNNIDEGVWSLSLPDYNILYLSQGVEKIYGYSIDEFKEKINLWQEIVHPDDKHITVEIHKKLREDGNAIRQCRIIKKDGTIAWVRDKSVLVRDDSGTPIRVDGVVSDITDLVQSNQEKEIAARANKAKSEFLANMSHEMRTPMNGIFGFLDILISKEIDEEKKDYLNIIKDSSNHLLGLINDILDLSKIDAGKFKIRESKVNLYLKAKSLCNNFIEQADFKNIDLDIDINPKLDKEIFIDDHSVMMILNNMLSNAIKFTHKGQVELRLNEVENHKIEMVIADTGIGISKEKQKRLYEPFDQGEYYLTKHYGGTGLGLAIVKRIVDLMGGEIFVETKVGIGTKFRVILPFQEIDDIKIYERISIAADSNRRALKIISADDVEINHKVLEKILSDKFNIQTFKKVYNGEELIEELEKADYDLVLMDVQMPKLNGIDATKIIRKGSKNSDILILGISAYAFEKETTKMMNAGMNDYLPKPVNKSELIKMIEGLLEM